MKSQDSKKQDSVEIPDEGLLIPIPKYAMVVKVTRLNFLDDGRLEVTYDADSVQMREDKIDEDDLDNEVQTIILEALTREAKE